MHEQERRYMWLRDGKDPFMEQVQAKAARNHIVRVLCGKIFLHWKHTYEEWNRMTSAGVSLKTIIRREVDEELDEVLAAGRREYQEERDTMRAEYEEERDSINEERRRAWEEWSEAEIDKVRVFRDQAEEALDQAFLWRDRCEAAEQALARALAELREHENFGFA